MSGRRGGGGKGSNKSDKIINVEKKLREKIKVNELAIVRLPVRALSSNIASIGAEG